MRVDDSVEKEPQEDGDAGRDDLLDHDVKIEDGAKEHQVPEKYEEGERAEKATDVGCQFGIIGSLKINTSTFLLPQSNARKLVKVFFTRRTSLVTHPITREKVIISNYQVEKLFSP